MHFKETKSIYLQISDLILERILKGEYKEGERIPSVRELGVDLSVNPHTCARSYELLTRLEIIESQRGLGYYVANGGSQKVREYLKNEFLKEIIPSVKEKMKLLDINPLDIFDMDK